MIQHCCFLCSLILINFVLPPQRRDNMDLEGYNPNTEWTLEGASVERHETVYECCPAPFVDITYTIRLQSRNKWILG